MRIFLDTSVLLAACRSKSGASRAIIDIAEKQSVDWWITSALESNIGLNAIAQWTYQLNVNRPQGLGTGALYTNNIEAPLKIDNGRLIYAPSVKWTINF